MGYAYLPYMSYLPTLPYLLHPILSFPSRIISYRRNQLKARNSGYKAGRPSKVLHMLWYLVLMVLLLHVGFLVLFLPVGGRRWTIGSGAEIGRAHRGDGRKEGRRRMEWAWIMNGGVGCSGGGRGRRRAKAEPGGFKAQWEGDGGWLRGIEVRVKD